MIRGIFRRRALKQSSPTTTRVSHELLDSLCDKINTLNIESTEAQNDARGWQRARTCAHVSKRFYCSFSRNGQQVDHLNSQGRIKRSIIERRLAFMKSKGLLEDPQMYLDRLIFANYQLYPVDKSDKLGELNLERMANGTCPFSFKKDYVIIHHLDQTHDGPWVILPQIFHQYYHHELHSHLTLEEGVRRGKFQREKNQYWKYRAQQLANDLAEEKSIASKPKT